MDKLVAVFAVIFTYAIIFGLVCLGVLLFALQFGFEWSFLLCVDVWLAIVALKWVFSRD